MRFDLNPQQNYTIDAYGLMDNIENQMLVSLIQQGDVLSKTDSVYIDYSAHRKAIHSIIKSFGFDFIESIQDKQVIITGKDSSDKISSVVKLVIKEKNGHDEIILGEDDEDAIGKNLLIKIISGYYATEDAKRVINLFNQLNDLSTNEKNITVKWVVDSQGRDFEITTSFKQKITDSLYPILKGGVESYVNKFLNSDQSILILIGEPGMAKTTLIRYILAEMNRKAYVTFDESVMANDYIFGEFVNSKSAGAFIIEDADTLLKSRQDNNKLMAKFLNVGDGLISLGNKKLIFTTNLPSTKDIDPALMRKGRCFDVLNFRRLTLDEANKVCHDFDLPEIKEGKDFTIADIFNRDDSEAEEVKSTGFGFLGK